MKEDNVIQYKDLRFGVVSLKDDIYPDHQTGSTILECGGEGCYDLQVISCGFLE